MSSTVAMIGQKISGGCAWTLSTAKTSGLWMYANVLTPVHTTITGNLANVAGKTTGVFGNIGGGIGIALILLSASYGANRLWHKKDLLQDQRALQIAARVLGFALAVAIGVATTAALSTAIAAPAAYYGIGLAFTAFTLLVDYDPKKTNQPLPAGNGSDSDAEDGHEKGIE